MNKFEFEHVFGPGVDQKGVFKEVEPLITSVLDGYNVCIFAYGQTGSGKTYTMEGPPSDPGVNHRALKSLFQRVKVWILFRCPAFCFIMSIPWAPPLYFES